MGTLFAKFSIQYRASLEGSASPSFSLVREASSVPHTAAVE